MSTRSVSTVKEVKAAARPLAAQQIKVIAVVYGKDKGSSDEGEAITGNKDGVIKADTKEDPNELAKEIIMKGLKGEFLA